jgi:hypothetical protein
MDLSTSYPGLSTRYSAKVQQIVHKTLPWKKPSQKRAGGVAQGIGPEFKP